MPSTETRTGAIAPRVDDVRSVAVDDLGELYLYPGTGTGGLGRRALTGTTHTPARGNL